MAVSLKQLRAKALERVKAIRPVQPARPYHEQPEDASVFVNFPHQVANRVAKMGLTHIMDPKAEDHLGWKNTRYKEERLNAEDELFAINPKDKHRPIYGSVNTGHFPNASMYGHIFIKFHPSINEFTTFSPADTLNAVMVGEHYDGQYGILRTKTFLGDVLHDRDDMGMDYAEAQIHHPLDLKSLREHAHYVGIDSRTLPGSAQHTKFIEAAKKVAKALGVPVYDSTPFRQAGAEPGLLGPDAPELPEPIWTPPVARIKAKAKKPKGKRLR